MESNVHLILNALKERLDNENTLLIQNYWGALLIISTKDAPFSLISPKIPVPIHSLVTSV
jgi:hypothetical protein